VGKPGGERHGGDVMGSEPSIKSILREAIKHFDPAFLQESPRFVKDKSAVNGRRIADGLVVGIYSQRNRKIYSD